MRRSRLSADHGILLFSYGSRRRIWREELGVINVRVGYTPHVELYAGNLGSASILLTGGTADATTTVEEGWLTR